MKAVVCAVAIGGWYHRGIARMITSFHEVSPGYEMQAWVNVLPPGAPRDVVEDGYDYTGYCAKPFALMNALVNSADIAILCDAAFYPIRHIHPLVEHIAQHGYYFCNNGNRVGAWSSDRALYRLGCSREAAWTTNEISSYCVGLNFSDGRCVELVQRWCGFAADRLTFPGPHTAPGQDGRNKGFVSTAGGVRGHRHDQTALSVIAHRMGMKDMIERPRFTAYLGSETEQTVLVNHGGF